MSCDLNTWNYAMSVVNEDEWKLISNSKDLLKDACRQNIIRKRIS